MTVVATLLEKTGLGYDALDRLLQLRFIDPARHARSSAISTCPAT